MKKRCIHVKNSDGMMGFSPVYQGVLGIYVRTGTSNGRTSDIYTATSTGRFRIFQK